MNPENRPVQYRDRLGFLQATRAYIDLSHGDGFRRVHNSWIDNVKTIIMELHDRFQPGCPDALEKAIGGFNYSKSTLDENIVITNLSRIAT